MAQGTLDRRAPPLFRQGPSLLSKTLAFAVLAVAVMVADSRFDVMRPVRTTLSAALAPALAVGRSPVVAAQSVAKYFADLRQAQRTAESANRALVTLAQQQAQLQQMQQENENLRQLLHVQQQQFPQGITAQIVFAAADAYSRKVLLNKGSADGVIVGSPVLDAAGVVGQVSQVYARSAEVSLLIGQGFTIPVRNQRTGQASVAYGSPTVGAGRLELKYLPSNVDMQVGDMLTTSGMDGVYPPHLAVATVESVDRRSDSTFARVYAKPVAPLGTGFVLVLAPVGLQGIEPQAIASVQQKPNKTREEKALKTKARKTGAQP